eukprot:SAG22_NODE_20293_length_267_cov_0.535714_1_plen_24_part_10
MHVQWGAERENPAGSNLREVCRSP